MVASNTQVSSPLEMSDPTIDIVDLQSKLDMDRALIQRAVRTVLAGAAVEVATISVVIVDNQRIQQLNRQYLQHDYATDVLSFQLDDSNARLEGEVIISAEMAVQRAPDYGWSAHDELLLYLVHGLLHLVGYEDASNEQKTAMRRQEALMLGQLGVACPRNHGHQETANEGERL